jgi:hypothetical protein
MDAISTATRILRPTERMVDSPASTRMTTEFADTDLVSPTDIDSSVLIAVVPEQGWRLARPVLFNAEFLMIIVVTTSLRHNL